jgi:hypothetical protein
MLRALTSRKRYQIESKFFMTVSVFQMQKAGGVNRVFAEVISGLAADYYPLVTWVENFGKQVPGHPNLQQPGFKYFRRGHVTPVFI